MRSAQADIELKSCGRCATPAPADARFCHQCGAAVVAASADPMIGRVIADRYLVIEKIGQGSSGTTYAADHTTLHKRVAIKMLHPELASNDAALERFRHEAMMGAELDNPHVLQVLDFGHTEDGRLFLAMEYLAGESLAAALERSRPLKLTRTIDIATQIAETLMEAHGLGYVHRDLRPRNIFLVNKHGRADFVKLLDFGLAKLMSPLVRSGENGVRVTDARYVSPEQARNETIDRRSDLYSLGVILFEMLTGTPPFSEGGALDILDQQMQAPVPRLRERRPDCPEWLDALVHRLLSKRPEERYPTALKLLEALQAQLVGDSPSVTRAKTALGTPLMAAAAAASATPVAPAPAPLAATPVAATPVAAEPIAVEVKAAIADAVHHAGEHYGARGEARRAEPAAQEPTRELFSSTEEEASAAPLAPAGSFEPPSPAPHFLAPAELPAPQSPPPPKGPETMSQLPPLISAHATEILEPRAAQAAAWPVAPVTRRPGWFDDATPASQFSSEPPPEEAFAARRKTPVAAIAAMAIVLVGIIGFTLMPAGPTQPPTASPPAVGGNIAAAPTTPVVPPPTVPSPPASREVERVASRSDKVSEPVHAEAKRKTKPPVEERAHKSADSPSAIALARTTRTSPEPSAAPPPMSAPSPPPTSSSSSAKVSSSEAELADFFVKMGRQKLSSNDLAGAAANFTKARQHDGRSADALAGLAEVSFEQGDFANATTQLKQALKIAPNRARYLVLLGQTYYKQGRPKEAVAEYQRALQLDPRNQEAQHSLELAQRKLTAKN